jgi:signal transduction histidine kinase
VQRIGDQGEAAGQDATDDLGDRQKRVRPDRNGNSSVAGLGVDMCVAMVVRHRVLA